MKTYYSILLAVLLFTARLSAQQLTPQALSFTNANILIQPEQTKFILGWNHGDSPTQSLSAALNMNVWHTGETDY